jgi:hypothetical protein
MAVARRFCGRRHDLFLIKQEEIAGKVIVSYLGECCNVVRFSHKHDWLRNWLEVMPATLSGEQWKNLTTELQYDAAKHGLRWGK